MRPRPRNSVPGLILVTAAAVAMAAALPWVARSAAGATAKHHTPIAKAAGPVIRAAGQSPAAKTVRHGKAARVGDPSAADHPAAAAKASGTAAKQETAKRALQEAEQA